MNGSATMYAKAGMSAPICQKAEIVDPLSEKYSGLVINQNQKTGSLSTNKITQEFYLPNDYIRNGKIPSLTGLKVYLNLTNQNTNINYKIYRYDDDLSHRSFTHNPITAISANGTTVTYTTAFEHSYKVNDKVIISGFSTNGYNGTFLITGISSTKTFTVNNSTTGTSTTYGYIFNYLSSTNTVTYQGEDYTRIARLRNRDQIKYKEDLVKRENAFDLFNMKMTFNKYSNNVKKGMLVSVWWKNHSLTNQNINLIWTPRSSVAPLIGKINKVDFKNHHLVLYLKNVKYKTIPHWKWVSVNYTYPHGVTSIPKDFLGLLGHEIWAKTKFGPYTFEEILDPDSNYDSENGWTGVLEGSTTNGNTTGDQWIDISFKSLEINSSWVDQKFKIVIETTDSNNNPVNSTIYYTSPSPLTSNNTNLTKPQAYVGNNVPVAPSSASILFKVKAAIADNEIDFLSNKVRSVAVKNNIDNAVNDSSYEHWSSKPNPSKYGVESIYFDVSDLANNPSVIDSVFLDPITPGVNFNIYYSNDSSGPGTDLNSWEFLLWNWVPQHFKTNKKQSYNLPIPITAKYIKIEFSSLQPSYYNPGENSKPILYKKFPSWVLNYFLSLYDLNYNKSYDPVLISQSNLQYDALDLAFNYYKGDILHSPNQPVVIDINNSQNNLVSNLLRNATDALSSYDITSLQNINASFDQFGQHPGYTMSNKDALSKNALLASINDYFNYSIEQMTKQFGTTAIVSHSDRNHLLLEKQMPTMYFYTTCRHGYQEAWAKFENNKAYFVKIRDIRFERNNHAVITDKGIYKFVPGDTANYDHNDFVSEDDVWKL
jgi:hypothetical protein